jgi:hypothetical protein
MLLLTVNMAVMMTMNQALHALLLLLLLLGIQPQRWQRHGCGGGVLLLLPWAFHLMMATAAAAY